MMLNFSSFQQEILFLSMEASLMCKNVSQMLTDLTDWHTLWTKLDLPAHTVKKIQLDQLWMRRGITHWLKIFETNMYLPTEVSSLDNDTTSILQIGSAYVEVKKQYQLIFYTVQVCTIASIYIYIYITVKRELTFLYHCKK